MLHEHEKRYIDALDIIVDDYNRTRHSSINMQPQNVTKANSAKLYEKVRTHWMNIERKHAKLSTGNFVRVKRKRDTFEKESMKPLWSQEIFKIVHVIPRQPYPVYEIADLNGRIVEGKLYEGEIQKIELPSDTPIEIIKRPNIFNRIMRVKTLEGKIREFDLKNEKKEQKIVIILMLFLY